MKLMPRHGSALLAERLKHWLNGDRLFTEECFRHFPAILKRPNLAVALICQEYRLLEEESGEPSVDEFVRRFPAFSARLQSHLGGTRFRTDAPAVGVRGPRGAARFLLRRRLGDGANGPVFRGLDSRDGSAIAIKVLRRKDARVTTNALEHIQRDFQKASGVKCANLCRLRGLISRRGTPCYIRDYVRGQSLADWLRGHDRARDIRRAVTIVWKVAKALAVVHNAGLVHRRVSPGNILLDHSGEPYLADLDLLQLPAGANGPLAPRAYRAPELSKPGYDLLNPAADVYSLGAVAHQLLTGALPNGSSLLVHRCEIDFMLDEILSAATSPHSTERFSTSGDFAAALHSWLRRRTFW